MASDALTRGRVSGGTLSACVAFTLGGLLAALWLPGRADATDASPPAAAQFEPTAAEVVAKNVAARGGLAAWRKVETMVWTGHLESDRTPAPSMPFLLDQKRPNKTRFEIHAMGEHSVRVFDGEQGWKSHSGGHSQPTVKPFTPDELRYARSEYNIDGPLIDADAKGSRVSFTGVEQLEGRKVYHLSVKLVSGEREEVWVDAKTYLDVQVARLTFGPNGAPRLVPTRYRDFKDFEGLKVPTTIQIGDGSTGPPDRMLIDRVALNLGLDDRLFAEPGTTGRRRALAPAARDAQSATVAR